jgi:hypothetical protein
VKCILTVLAFLVFSTASYAQTSSTICLPIGTFAPQAERHGEYPAFMFKDIVYGILFTMYINPKTRSYTLTGVSDANPEVECLSSVGLDFNPVVNKPKGTES